MKKWIFYFLVIPCPSKVVEYFQNEGNNHFLMITSQIIYTRSLRSPRNEKDIVPNLVGMMSFSLEVFHRIWITLLIHCLRRDGDISIVPRKYAVEDGGLRKNFLIRERREGATLELRGIEESLFSGGKCDEHHATGKRFRIGNLDFEL